jgi:hypothetical protein
MYLGMSNYTCQVYYYVILLYFSGLSESYINMLLLE